MFMEQRAAVRFLTLKGLCASAIAAELDSVYETEALALSIVKKWRKCFAEGKTSLCDGPRSGRLLTTDFAEAISLMLKERLYLSRKLLCWHFRNAKGTRLPILHDALGMEKFHLRWVPHTLDTNQKAERVTLLHATLSISQSVHSTGFHSAITGDESWFFLYYRLIQYSI
jgi:hypothetical protein